nr:unknown protein [synthetic construct]
MEIFLKGLCVEFLIMTSSHILYTNTHGMFYDFLFSNTCCWPRPGTRSVQLESIILCTLLNTIPKQSCWLRHAVQDYLHNPAHVQTCDMLSKFSPNCAFIAFEDYWVLHQVIKGPNTQGFRIA